MDIINKKIEHKLCPKCIAKWYLIETMDDEGKITYKCPKCDYKEFPDS